MTNVPPTQELDNSPARAERRFISQLATHGINIDSSHLVVKTQESDNPDRFESTSYRYRHVTFAVSGRDGSIHITTAGQITGETFRSTQVGARRFAYLVNAAVDIWSSEGPQTGKQKYGLQGVYGFELTDFRQDAGTSEDRHILSSQPLRGAWHKFSLRATPLQILAVDEWHSPSDFPLLTVDFNETLENLWELGERCGNTAPLKSLNPSLLTFDDLRYCVHEWGYGIVAFLRLAVGTRTVWAEFLVMPAFEEMALEIACELGTTFVIVGPDEHGISAALRARGKKILPAASRISSGQISRTADVLLMLTADIGTAEAVCAKQLRIGGYVIRRPGTFLPDFPTETFPLRSNLTDIVSVTKKLGTGPRDYVSQMIELRRAGRLSLSEHIVALAAAAATGSSFKSEMLEHLIPALQPNTDVGLVLQFARYFGPDDSLSNWSLTHAGEDLFSKLHDSFAAGLLTDDL